MIAIIGLGNPEEKYELTRHNVGFLAINNIASTASFPPLSLNKTLLSLQSQSMLHGKDVIIMNPQTYMNKSGKAAKAILSYRKIPPSSLIVIHDDIDIPFGEARTVFNRGSAGHRGIDSVIQELGTQAFWRMRIGVLPATGKPQDTDKFVLSRFSSQEQEELPRILEKIREEIDKILESLE
ncbi:MAG: aminoacyl-tRNA hydrolase [bacterium]|nr:aminoacyl-tRNA hydrolase [bacterium]